MKKKDFYFSNTIKTMTASVREIQQPARLNPGGKFSAILLLIIGVVYLLVWLVSVFSETTGFVQMDDKRISMNTAEFLNHLRTILIIVFSVAGSLALFKLRKSGWVMANAVFLLFLTIVSGGFYQAIKLGDTTLIAIAGSGILVLLAALVFLWLPAARMRLAVTRSTMFIAVALSAGTIAFYLFLQ